MADKVQHTAIRREHPGLQRGALGSQELRVRQQKQRAAAGGVDGDHDDDVDDMYSTGCGTEIRHSASVI